MSADTGMIDTDTMNNFLGILADSATQKYKGQPMAQPEIAQALQNREASGEFMDRNDPKRGVVASRSTSPASEEQLNSPAVVRYNGNTGETPSAEAVAATVTSPLVGDRASNNALAAATQNPDWTAKFNDIIGNLQADKENAITNIVNRQQAELEAGDKIQRLQDSKGELAAQSIRNKAAQDSAIAADKYATVSRAGVNTSELDSVVNQVLAGNVQLFKEMAPLRDKITQEQSVNFLDDPATWFANQFSLPGDIQRHNALLAKVQAGSDFVKSQDNLVTATMNANAGKLASMNTAEVDNLAQQAAIDSQMKAQQAEVNKLKLQGATDKEIEAVNDRYKSQILALEQRGEAKIRQAAEDQARTDQRALVNEQRGTLADQRKLVADEKQRKLDDQKATDERVAQAAQSLFLPGIKTAAQLDKESPEVKRRVKAVLDSGGNVLGTSPVQVADNWKSVQAAYTNSGQRDAVLQQYPPQQMELGNYVKNSVDQIAFQNNKTLGLTGDKLATVVNENLSNQLTQLKNDPEKQTVIVNGQPTNWYKAPPLVDVAKLPSLGGNIYGTAAMEMAKVSTDGKAITPQAVMTSLANRIYNKEINITDAAKDINKFYQTVVDGHNDAMQFTRFGAPIQDNYPVSMSGKTRDLLSPVGAQQMLLDAYRAIDSSLLYGIPDKAILQGLK